MIHRTTCEAKHLITAQAARLPRFYLVAVEGIEFSQPLPIESVGQQAEGDFEAIDISVWHDRAWMFGVNVQPDTVVTFTHEGPDDELLQIPKPPDRTGQVRVHGAWKRRGEVSWAPDGHPIAFPPEG
jgi:hypothetical protein